MADATEKTGQPASSTTCDNHEWKYTSEGLRCSRCGLLRTAPPTGYSSRQEADGVVITGPMAPE